MSGQGMWFCACLFVLIFGYARARSSILPICYPPGTINFIRGLGLDQLPPGVHQTCDENGLVAYNVYRDALIVEHFRRVLRHGFQNHSNLTKTGWPGDFSVSMRLQMWEWSADIINILDANGGHRFGISAGIDGVFLKFNGMPHAVKISSVNVADRKFHRILLSFRGRSVFSRVSGPNISTCGHETTRQLMFGTQDRTIPINRGFVVLGREGNIGIETPQVTIQQLVFMPDPLSAYSCPYEISCTENSEASRDRLEQLPKNT